MAFIRGRESPGVPQASKEESAAGRERSTSEPDIFSSFARKQLSARCRFSEGPSNRSQPRPVAYTIDFQRRGRESAVPRKRSMVRAISAGRMLTLAMAVDAGSEND